MTTPTNQQAAFADSMPVQPRYAFDLDRLHSYLQANVEDYAGRLEIEQFRGGQSNPTFLLRAGGRRYVLRRKPDGKLLRSAHAVDREYRVMNALKATGVPVPEVLALCTDESVIGSVFFVMSFLDGRIFWNPGLPDCSPQERRSVYAEANRTIARLHAVDPDAVGLSDFGKRHDYFVRHIRRWTEQYRAAETERIATMDRLIEWLPEHIPASDELALAHGDFRIDNLVFHPTEARVIGILDWELSTLGNPLSDFAYHCMSWRAPPGNTRGLSGLDLHALGIPSEEEYVAAYCRNTGRFGIADWDFYLAYNFFRVAAISQGVYRRGLDGNASNVRALDAGGRAKVFAELGWQTASNTFLRSNGTA